MPCPSCPVVSSLPWSVWELWSHFPSSISSGVLPLSLAQGPADPLWGHREWVCAASAPFPHGCFDPLSNGMGLRPPRDPQLHQTSEPGGFVVPRVLPVVITLKSLPLLLPTPAPNNTNQRHISSQRDSLGSTLGIPTAPHPPSKAAPSPPIAQNLSPWSRCLLPAGSVGSGDSHWCPTGELPGAGCHVEVAPWVAGPHLPSPLQQPNPSGPAPMDMQLPEGGGKRGAVGSCCPTGAGGQLGHHPHEHREKSLTLDGSVLLVISPALRLQGTQRTGGYSCAVPTAPQGCPGAGASMGTWAVPTHSWPCCQHSSGVGFG